MKVKELLSSENKWAQGFTARRPDDRPVSPHSPEAVKWCVVGAIACCYQNPAESNAILDLLAKCVGYRDAGDWNDDENRTFAEVCALLEELDI